MHTNRLTKFVSGFAPRAWLASFPLPPPSLPRLAVSSFLLSPLLLKNPTLTPSEAGKGEGP